MLEGGDRRELMSVRFNKGEEKIGAGIELVGRLVSTGRLKHQSPIRFLPFMIFSHPD